MIVVNAGTMIDGKVYTCIKIEDGYAYLNEVGKRGRPRKIDVNRCPYFEGSELIVPEPLVKKKKRREAKNINVMKLFKDTVKDLSESHEKKFSVSRSMSYYLHDMLESFVTLAADYAVDNAIREDTNRVSPRHVYWPKLDKIEAQHINPEADDWALHLRDTYYAKE